MKSKSFPSLKGQLLVDPGKLQGSFFHRTVVLVCEHDKDGAFGLVLNRQTEAKVGDALVADISDSLKQLPLFHGGPVQSQVVSYLHTDLFLPEANVITNLHLGHSVDTLIDLGDSYSSTQQIKIFAGYSGWSSGQLEDELRRETWMIYPATLDLIYHAHPEQLWHLILRKKGGIYKIISDGPEDLSWN